MLALLFVFLCTFGASAAQGSSLIYQNFIVRYDRGWDILCEPYVVQKDDWVLKIFRQKGEIAHQDFHDFLGIFQRLNPHVQDIDMIRPGQIIDIPLRKLEHGSLPGQASGVVTIPFVNLAKVIDVLHQNTPTYQVQRGDTVSKLIAARFGRYGSKAYTEGVKLLQTANPEITDINHILAGQTIYMPDPSIREKEWYDALYDEKGELRDTINLGARPPSADSDGDGPPSSASALETPYEATMHPDALSAAAAAVGGKLLNKGTYFVPRPGQDDFEVDLSKHPLLDMQTGSVLFSRNGQIMNQPPELVQQYWQEIKVVSYDEQASVQQLVGAIFEALNAESANADVPEAGFDDHGVRVAVRSKWIKAEDEQRRLCIVPISDMSELTPESMRRYLEQHGLVLRELLPDGNSIPASSDRSLERHAIKDILTISASGQKDFVQRLMRVLKFSYAPDVSVSFPYAGIEIQAYADLVSTSEGQEILLDFGDLYGDAVKALRQNGQNVVQIAAEDGHTAIVFKILSGLGVPFSENPSFLAAARSAQYNTSITIPGIFYTGQQDKRILLSGTVLHPAVSDVLSTVGVAVVTW